MKNRLKTTGFIVALAFLAWAYFNYPFQMCPEIMEPGEYIPCDYANIHGYLNAKYYPMGYAVVALAALAGVIFIYTSAKKHRQNLGQK